MINTEKTAMEEISIEKVSRRNFLQGMLSASAFVLCVHKSPLLARIVPDGAFTVGGANASIDPATISGAAGPRAAAVAPWRSTALP